MVRWQGSRRAKSSCRSWTSPSASPARSPHGERPARARRRRRGSREEIGTSFFSVKIGMFDNPETRREALGVADARSAGERCAAVDRTGRQPCPVRPSRERAARSRAPGCSPAGAISRAVWFSGLGAGIRVSPKVFLSATSAAHGGVPTFLMCLPIEIATRSPAARPTCHASPQRVRLAWPNDRHARRERCRHNAFGCGLSLFFRGGDQQSRGR
jgi:hypothetical protein